MSTFSKTTVSFGANSSWLAPSAIQCDTIEQSDFDDQTYSDKDSDLEYPNIPASIKCKKEFNTISPKALLSSENDNSSDKKKVAPRSGLQFKPGPAFESTDSFKSIFLGSNGEKLFPFISARIDRGFDYMNGEWIGYKRNYFTLVAAFEFDQYQPSIFSKEKFYTFDDNDNKVNINYFAIRLVSKCCEDDVPVSLVQHTAKRDRGPQFKPPVYPAISGTLPSHILIKSSANIRNENKIDQFNKLFFFDGNDEEKPSTSILSTYPDGTIAKVARYERIQFSTSINQRKPSMVNRHFILSVELLGYVGQDEYFVMAATETPPLIIRGRSPSNYQMAKINNKFPSFKSKSDQFVSPGSNNGNFDPSITQERTTPFGNTREPQAIERRANKLSSIEGKDTINEFATKKAKEGLKKSRRSRIKRLQHKLKNNQENMDENIPISTDITDLTDYEEDTPIRIEHENELRITNKTEKNPTIIDCGNNKNSFKCTDLQENDENYDSDQTNFNGSTTTSEKRDHFVKLSNSFQLVTNYSEVSNYDMPSSPYFNNSIESYDVNNFFNYSDGVGSCALSQIEENNKLGFTLETNYHLGGFADPAVMVETSRKKKSNKRHLSKKKRKLEVSANSFEIDSESFDFSPDISDPDIRYSQSSYISEFLA